MPCSKTRIACAATTFLFALLLCSCTGGQSTQGAAQEEITPDPVASGSLTASGLRILPGCLADEPESIELAVEWDADGHDWVATVFASGLRDARALYFSLPLDNQEAASAQLSGMDWAGEGALSLAVQAAPAELHVGIAMLYPQERHGFTGSTQLVTLRFPAETAAGNRGRTVSTPPLQEQSRIDLDYDPLSNRFNWFYRNLGDYDQNGEVNISDLTQVAIHFGKTAGGQFAEESVDSVVDGDGNGEINIADITPIGVGFGNRVDSYKLYRGVEADYPAAPNAPSTIVAQQIVQFGENTADPAAERLRYDIASSGLPDPAPAYWLRPVDFGVEGIPSLIAGNGNMPPVASLVASQEIGIAPLQVTLDASGSTDPEGGPLGFRWVIFEKSSMPTEDSIFVAGSIVQRELEAGEYAVGVIVQDDDGANSFADLDLLVVPAPGWSTAEIEVQLGDTPAFTLNKMLDVDLAEVGGVPWIGFAYLTDLGGVRFGVRISNSISGTGEETKVYLDAEGDIEAAQVELLPDSGGAHAFCLLDKLATGRITHYWVDQSTTFPSPDSITTDFHLAQDMSVALIDGRPAVSYYDGTDGHLKFALADEAQGSTWPTPAVIDGTGSSGSQGNLGLLGAGPVVAYYSDGGLRIRYVDSTLAGGLVTWNSPTTVKPWPGALMRDALQVLPGDQRWLLVHDTGAMSLLTLTEPAFTTETQVAATTGNHNDLFSTAIIDGQLCIAWYDRTAQTLRFLRSTNAGGTAWEPPSEIANGLLVGALSLCEIAGRPALAWFNGLEQTVHYSLLIE